MSDDSAARDSSVACIELFCDNKEKKMTNSQRITSAAALVAIGIAIGYYLAHDAGPSITPTAQAAGGKMESPTLVRKSIASKDNLQAGVLD